MNEEELLAEAKNQYPVGTEIVPLNLHLMFGYPKTTIIDKNNHYLGGWGDFYGIWVSSGSWCSVVYSNGKWAEIIK